MQGEGAIPSTFKRWETCPPPLVPHLLMPMKSVLSVKIVYTGQCLCYGSETEGECPPTQIFLGGDFQE